MEIRNEEEIIKKLEAERHQNTVVKSRDSRAWV